MTILLYVLWSIALAAYLGAAGLVPLYLRDDRATLIRGAGRLTGVAALFLGLAVLFRGIALGSFPIASAGDSINLLLLLSTLVAIYVIKRDNVPNMHCFVAPVHALLGVTVLIFNPKYLLSAQSDLINGSENPLSNPFLMIHVGLASLAYAMFLVASVTSIAYVFQSRNLKRANVMGLFQKLPSLAELDAMLYRLIRMGYVLFAITFVLGWLWAFYDSDQLDDRWWLSPKIIRAFVMVVFYSAAFHGRRMGKLRGQHLAYFVFIGFTALIFVYIALQFLDLSNYQFMGDAS